MKETKKEIRNWRHLYLELASMSIDSTQNNRLLFIYLKTKVKKYSSISRRDHNIQVKNKNA